MQGFVERGDDWMKPLLEFRDWLKVMRNEARYRKKTRRDGKPGLGPYTLKARREIYQRLIQTEQLVRGSPEGRGLRLIEPAEKKLIEELWKQDGYRGRRLAALEIEARASVKNLLSYAV
jgi:DNA sulfur modification protein DndC